MKCSYEYDQDPRYGWASIDLEGQATGLVIIHTLTGSLGFDFSDQSMKPTCICKAYCQSECSCPHLEPDYWEGTPDD